MLICDKLNIFMDKYDPHVAFIFVSKVPKE